MPIRFMLAAALCTATVTTAGCGGSSYGSTPLVGSSGGQAALGSSTPTPTGTVAPAQTAVQTAPPAQTSAPVATARPTPPPTQKAAPFAIAINGDNTSKPQFDPPAARVYTGTVITFTNRDTVPRSAVSDNGVFDSGPIAPGATWQYTAATVGTFNYHDGTRPYAVAYFQVVSP
jgi:plastocyanin